MSRVPAVRARRALLALLLGVTAFTASSCAFYNTFYLARKYYFKATLGAPYAIDGSSSISNQNGQAAPNFQRSIDYSKKLLANYPRSKWVDDAYLLWARALLGRDDPLKTIEMLTEFKVKFPQSPVLNEATFYLGIANRQARKYDEAVQMLNAFLEAAPRHELAPHAYLELSRALMSLKRPKEAAEAASHVLDQFPKSELADRARLARAQARFAQGAYKEAREDYRYIGAHAADDQSRFEYLLDEVDTIESARDYEGALALLRDALSHTVEPIRSDTTGGRPPVTPTGAEAERFGRLMIRVGTVQLVSGHLDQALASYQRVIEDYPHSALAAEAQYRIGYAYENYADDFERARNEYAKVKEQGGSQAFQLQAQTRLANIDRLSQYKSASGDTLERHAEQGMLRAELYLFQLEKPERAIEEYQKIVDAMPGTAYAARALNAKAWVLSRKLDREAEAESLFWKVVREYPATEGQLAARDYLERAGREVPSDLIVMPKPKPVVEDSTALTSPPATVPALGVPSPGLFAPRDSLGRPLRGMSSHPGTLFPPGAPPGGTAPVVPPSGTTPLGPPPMPHPDAPGDSSGADPQTKNNPPPAPPDTTGHHR